LKKLYKLLMAISCFLAPGCSNNSLEYYDNRQQKIDLRSFFAHEVEGWGGIFDYQGRQTRSFHVKIKGTWQQDRGQLAEIFLFDDGEVTERIWEIKYSTTNNFTATAKDVIGDAKGSQQGNAINMSYTLQIPYNNRLLNVGMDDWMYLISNDTILNRTSMKKFGVKVAEVVLVMKKVL
jgi:Protein of unknown function (DUF3833)